MRVKVRPPEWSVIAPYWILRDDEPVAQITVPGIRADEAERLARELVDSANKGQK